MNSALHFLHIYCLDFHLKKKILPSNFEKILWSNKFLKVTLIETIFYENKTAFAFYEILGFGSWLYNLPILTLWHIVGLST
jgi:hypothetical protein